MCSLYSTCLWLQPCTASKAGAPGRDPGRCTPSVFPNHSEMNETGLVQPFLPAGCLQSIRRGGAGRGGRAASLMKSDAPKPTGGCQAVGFVMLLAALTVSRNSQVCPLFVSSLLLQTFAPSGGVKAFQAGQDQAGFRLQGITHGALWSSHPI